MTTNIDVFQAGVDAIIADNTLGKNGFRNALQTVSTRISNAEGTAWCDAFISEYFNLELIGADQYGGGAGFRSFIILRGAESSVELFGALQVVINSLPETVPITEDLRVTDLRAERDEVQTSIDTMTGFRTGATRQVKDALNLGIDQLRVFKESLRSQIKAILGDPNA